MLQYAFLRENPEYIIYNDGRLFSIKSGKFLVPNTYKGGYLKYTIYKDSKPTYCHVHRLVAQYFVPNNLKHTTK